MKEKLDKEAIKYILKKDTDSFIGYINKTGATICGILTISLLLNILKDLDKIDKMDKLEKLHKKHPIESRLLSYYTSGDILGDWNNSVSYAAIIFSQHFIKPEVN